MPLYYYPDGITYGYDVPTPEADSVTIDGQEFRRIERLPRNVREGDVIRIGDNTDRAGYAVAYVTVTDVAYWPQSFGPMGRRYAPSCRIAFKLRPEDDTYRWRSWGFSTTYRDEATHEPISVYVPRGSNRR